MLPELWGHQERTVNEIFRLMYDDVRRIVVQSPTGSGKSRIMSEIIIRLIARDPATKISLYTNRRSLLSQTSGNLSDARIVHGIRAADHQADLSLNVQLSSTPTEHSRTKRKLNWQLHPSQFVIVDEAHIQSGPSMTAILDAHFKQGAYIIGFSATPVGLAELYDHLLIGATMEECRQAKAILPSDHFAPDEPDMRSFRLQSKIDNGDAISEAEARKAIMTPGLIGRILLHYNLTNPHRKPSILFAPGVRESLWLAERFNENGIPAAHIDGTNVYVDGKMYSGSDAAREDVIARSESGDIKVLCNRFVMREGIDMPWLYHVIIATLFSTVVSYIQSVGRAARFHKSMDHFVIQDHGGHWWRFGSFDDEVNWRLDDTAQSIASKRAERIREKKQRERYRCPKCGRIVGFKTCPCGHVFTNKLEPVPVITTDGTLRHMTGNHFRPRRIYGACNCGNNPHCNQCGGTGLKNDGIDKWIRMYHRARSEKWNATFRQAIALFAYENDWQWPSMNWPLMPVDEHDRYKLVADVPKERLNPLVGV